MKLVISPKAEKKLKKIPKFDQIAIGQKIRIIGETKDLLQEEKLRGFKDTFRIRVGDYRIVYRRSAESVYIILIGHRKEIYDLLRQLLK